MTATVEAPMPGMTDEERDRRSPGMTPAQCRRLLYGYRLTVWGEHMRETYTRAGQGDDGPPPTRVYVPLVHIDYLADITEAFAALAPDTPARGMRFSTLTRKRFNPHQRALWLFYVVGLGDLTAEDKQRVIATEGETRIERGVRDWRGDDRVGQHLGVGGRQANRLRCEAVGLLAARLAPIWDRRAA